MVKSPVPTIAAAISLLYTFRRHCTTQVGPTARPKLDPFHSNTAVELPTACHVKVTASMVHDGAAVLVVRCAGLVYIRACDRFGCAFEATVRSREYTVCLLAGMAEEDSLLQRT